MQLQTGNFPYISSEELEAEQKLRGLNAGGSLSIIELDEKQFTPEELLGVTKQLVEKQAVEFLTYNRRITYCSNCEKSWFGALHKCPSCGAISTVVQFDKFNAA